MSEFFDFNSIINHIENNLFDDIDVNELAKKAKLSVYEFRRIFSFVVGTPVYEYIRKRRLSLCVKMILDGESLSDVALKCKYDNLSSFSRAFKDFYGFSPTEARNNPSKIKVFTKAGFEVKVRGGFDIECEIVELPNFFVNGIKGTSDITDTECCDKVWKVFNNSKVSKLYNEKTYAVYFNGDNSVTCYIGKKSDKLDESLDSCYLEKGLWACFKCYGFDDEKVNSFYKNVLYSWFESTNYVKDDKRPNLEIYSGDLDNDYVWNICIPVIVKEK